MKVPSGSGTVKVDKSGTPDGYVLYDGTGSTIDCANGADLAISVDASYVILRGFTIKNVKQHGIRIMGGDSFQHRPMFLRRRTPRLTVLEITG